MRKTLMSKYGNPDLQSIDFQSPLFFNDLTACIDEIRKLKKNDIPESELISQLSGIIKHHTELDVQFEIDSVDPCVEIPKVNKNNILINSFIREYVSSSDGIKMINDSKSIVRGNVSLKTGEVSGIFKEVKIKIYLPLYMFVETKFESAEIAAITLHEVGHILTYFEYISRTVTTNQALAGLAKAIDNSGTIEEREAVLITVKKALDLKDLDAKELAKSNNKKVIELVVITNITKQSESELGSNVYDFSSWEYLADQYTTRYGAGRHLITGLEKIYKGHFNISFRSLPAYLIMEAIKLISIINPLIFLVLVTMDGDGNGTYDKPGARFKRIRDQIVENLKDKTLSKESVESLREDLVEIDRILMEVNDRRQFLSLVWDVISPSARKELNQKKLQQDLEAIAFNELFVKSAELKQFS